MLHHGWEDEKRVPPSLEQLQILKRCQRLSVLPIKLLGGHEKTSEKEGRRRWDKLRLIVKET